MALFCMLTGMSQEGEIYDSPESAKSIPGFIETYNLDTKELLEPDISKYGTFNEFFYRCASKPYEVPIPHY